MKSDRTLEFLYVPALLLFVAGVVWTAFTLSRMSVYERRLADRQNDLRTLRVLELERNRQQGAIRAFDMLDDDAPASLNAIASIHFGGVLLEIRARTTIELPNGWNVKRVELVCADAPLDRLPAFLQAAESGRPPWRLIDCDITASRTDGGAGRLVLGLEALSGQAEPEHSRK